MNDYADARLDIDLAALVKNYQLLAKRAARAQCAAVVKANAYGLGMADVAAALAKQGGCTQFFVAHLDEALDLRKLLKKAEIYVFSGLRAKQEAVFTAHRITPVLNHPGEVALWQNHARKQGKALPAILHIDTGMNRLGMTYDEAKNIDSSGISLNYIMSHLACANEPVDTKSPQQLKDFNRARKLFPGVPCSLANSGGIFLAECYHFDLVRPGMALYGSNPTQKRKNPMHPVVTLSAPIIQLRTLDKKDTVGYGATQSLKKGSQIAVLPVGYADGFMRSLSHTSYVYFGKHRAPVVGRVSMDLIIVDVSQLPQNLARLGSMATLIGRHNPVDLVAQEAGTISYEILTRLGSRFSKNYHF